MIKKYWQLILILIIATVLRFWQLGIIPPSLTWDEAALGYNAYSILKTGKDEYGNVLPLNLKSFGDYKPAVYAYLDIPFVLVFGLNEFAVRFPAALLGVLLVVVVYFLAKELFANTYLALSVALTTAISPLAIFFSRPAFETSVALFLNTLATWLFIKGTKNTTWFIWSAIIFGMSLFTYQASRLFVPLLLIGLVIIYKNQITINFKTKISIGIILFFISLVGYSLFIVGESTRLSTVSFLSYQRSEEELSQIAREQSSQLTDFQFQFFHGEWFAYLRGFFERYLIYFSPKTLFVEGDTNPRHDIPDFGILYYSSMVLIPLGFIFLVKNITNNAKGIYLIFFWLLVAPIPAVLSKDLLNMIRAFNITLPLSILEGAGLYFLLSLIKHKSNLFFKIAVIIVGLIILVNVTLFIDRYFVHLPKQLSWGWVYGFKEAFSMAGDPAKLSKYSEVAITDEHGQPYIYYLFYNKYSPEKFQKQAVLDQQSTDVGSIHKIDNIEFRFVDWRSDRLAKNALFIGTFEELPENDIKPFPEFTILKDIHYLDGRGALRVVEVK